MYLLDTNVISEMRKFRTGQGNPSVLHWAKGVDPNSLYLSAITVFEIETGVLRMMLKDAVQARLLGDWLHLRVLPEFERRILPVELTVALQCAALNVPTTRPYRDSLIAATALVHGMTVVTRNERDFVPMGVRVLNPWSA